MHFQLEGIVIITINQITENFILKQEVGGGNVPTNVTSKPTPLPSFPYHLYCQIFDLSISQNELVSQNKLNYSD